MTGALALKVVDCDGAMSTTMYTLVCTVLTQIAALLTSYGGRLTYGDAFQSGDFNKIWQQLLPVDSKGTPATACASWIRCCVLLCAGFFL